MSKHRPDLARRLERGEYVIDAEAIAEAIVRRSRMEWFLGSRLAEVLEAGERHGEAGAVEQQRSGARPDLA